MYKRFLLYLLPLIVVPSMFAEEVGGIEVAKILEQLGAKLEEGVSEDQREAYTRHFDLVDADGDGSHSKTEYIESGNYLTPQARQGIFSAADQDQDGIVTKAEYLLNRIITDEAKAIIQVMDDDGDGAIQRAEFVAHAGPKFPDDAELTSEVFTALDTNDDGEIFVPEYLRVWGQWARAEGAPTEDPGILTLDRIFVEKEFKSKSFSVKWREDSEGYTFLKSSDDEGKEIWQFRPGDKEPTVLVASLELVPVGETAPLSIDGYTFSKDESLLLIYTKSQRVWRQNTRGDYWILDRASGELRQLGGDAPSSSLMFAKISPTGAHVAYVRERNIYVEDLRDHSIHAITETPSDSIINGTADWVYEEELGVRDGFRWSPDGKRIAYWRFDESDVRKYTLVDNVSGLYPKLTTFGYPKVGQRNASCRIEVTPIGQRATQIVDVPGEPHEHYIARMDWVGNSDELVIQQLNRAQNTNRILLSQGGGKVREIYKEQDDAWVDVHNAMHWVLDGSHFTWMSDRDGWQHLYLISKDGKESICLTPGEFDVMGLSKVDHEGQWVYFIASPEDPAERYLYRVDYAGENLTRVTPSEEKRGTHAYNISPDGKFAVVTSSHYDEPPVTRLVSLPDHAIIEVLESNEKLKKKVELLKRTPTEFFQVDIGVGESLRGRCTKPPGFDPDKSYPLLMHVYGEPAGQIVTDRWGGDTQLWHWMLAQQGYVIMSFDNRGTASPQGRAFRKAAFRKIGILAPQDQAAAVQAVLKERPYLDPKRVGSWGWSGGGSMSLNAIFKYPDIYKTAIAVASVPNQRYYDTIYQERYMGLPGENVEAYREGSPINFADQLEGDLLIVHGANDDNCHYQTFEMLVDKLIQYN
ncbi:MAG: DPP IV N-terminal domain-containing protein, partial [Verrucomicrobiales bacterium]